MAPSYTWTQWEGRGYPSVKSDPTIYYYPDTVDIEDPDNLNELITEMHMDGVVPSKGAARALLENAIIVHGEVVELDGDLVAYFETSKEFGFETSNDATWVELDEYAE